MLDVYTGCPARVGPSQGQNAMLIGKGEVFQQKSLLHCLHFLTASKTKTKTKTKTKNKTKVKVKSLEGGEGHSAVRSK